MHVPKFSGPYKKFLNSGVATSFGMVNVQALI